MSWPGRQDPEKLGKKKIAEILQHMFKEDFGLEIDLAVFRDRGSSDDSPEDGNKCRVNINHTRAVVTLMLSFLASNLPRVTIKHMREASTWLICRACRAKSETRGSWPARGHGMLLQPHRAWITHIRKARLLCSTHPHLLFATRAPRTQNVYKIGFRHHWQNQHKNN